MVQLDAWGAISGQIGPPADWKKLIGSSPNGDILGVIGYDVAHPAVLTPDGVLASLPEPATPAEREQLQILLMESLRYDTAAIRIGDSERGGGGTDIYLEHGSVVRNISDCGTRRCGQAVLTPDGSAVLYVVARR